jgi:large subunit ribosomal protein L37Ae
MTKKTVGSAGRLGVRYGKKIRERLSAVEAKQRQKQKCPYCSRLSLKRLSKGVWICKKCSKKFAGAAYCVE